MYQALYRKWRPQVFDDVIGQNHITKILKSEINNNRISHAYLFCGPRGTGKTTCAKIIAKAVNCDNPIDGNPCGKCPSCLSITNNTTTDVIEMDAASNNGVNDIRDIRETVVYTPAELKYRVYIIDEVHMLSISAFNALLKTLEEPPSHVIFVLATTELQKIPVTILSRCQRFDFHRVTPLDIISRLETVCHGERIKYDNESLELISKLAQGSFRDALNMLEFCASENNELNITNTSNLLGTSSIEILSGLINSIAENNTSTALETLNDIYLSSRDIIVFWRELISFVRDLLLVKSTRGTYITNDITKRTSELFSVSKLLNILDVFAEAEVQMNALPQNAKLYAEIALIKVSEPRVDTSISSIVDRINRIENIIADGSFPNNTKENVSTSQIKSDVSIKNSVNNQQNINVEKNSDIAPEKLVLKGIKNWPEVVREVSTGISFTLGSILKTSFAYEGNDNKIYIDFPNGYTIAVVQLSEQENKQKFLAIINRLLKKTYKDGDFILRDKDKNIKEEVKDEFESLIN